MERANVIKKGALAGLGFLAGLGVPVDDYAGFLDENSWMINRPVAAKCIRNGNGCGPYRTPKSYGFKSYKGTKNLNRPVSVTLCMPKGVWKKMVNFAKERGERAWVGYTVAGIRYNPSFARCKTLYISRRLLTNGGVTGWTICDGIRFSTKITGGGVYVLRRR